MQYAGAHTVLLLFIAVAGSSKCDFSKFYPRHYVTHYTASPPVIDGRLDDSAWREIAFSEPFVDISTSNVPRFSTAIKMRWDKTHLYVGALLEERDIWANQTQRNSVIFYDNDIEVFIDCDGSNHFYKEFEMNALGTTWSLCLNKPYLNGGYENSSRVFGPRGWDDLHMRAAAFTTSRINDPTSNHRQWTAEVAFPLESMIYNTSASLPVNGSYWRINFSRVEWRVLNVNGHYEKDPAFPNEDNWVWNAQGDINMHHPERWGYLQFSTGAPNSTQAVPDPAWGVRYMAMELYNTQLKYQARHGVYAETVDDLIPFATNASYIDGSCSPPITLDTDPDGGAYVAHVLDPSIMRWATVQDDRFLKVSKAMEAAPTLAAHVMR